MVAVDTSCEGTTIVGAGPPAYAEVMVASVRELAAGYLDSRPLPTDVAGWALERGTGSPDGETAVVVLTAQVNLPVVGAVLDALGSEVSVTVTSRARAVIR